MRDWIYYPVLVGSPMPNFSTWCAPEAILANGERVPSDSSAWLLECEVRHLFNLGSVDARRAELDLIEKRRGKAARQDLEQRILALWQTERSKCGY